MNSLGIFTGKDLRRFDQVDLLKHFGKSGKHYFEIVRSIQDNPVNQIVKGSRLVLNKLSQRFRFRKFLF